MKKEYRCHYCGGKGATFCDNCQKKLPLVRDLLQMVKNKAEEVRGNGIQEKR